VADDLDEDDVKLLFRRARLDRPARMRIQEVSTGLLRTVFLPDDCTIVPIDSCMEDDGVLVIKFRKKEEVPRKSKKVNTKKKAEKEQEEESEEKDSDESEEPKKTKGKKAEIKRKRKGKAQEVEEEEEEEEIPARPRREATLRYTKDGKRMGEGRGQQANVGNAYQFH
jgi:hypothetical protein